MFFLRVIESSETVVHLWRTLQSLVFNIFLRDFFCSKDMVGGNHFPEWVSQCYCMKYRMLPVELSKSTDLRHSEQYFEIWDVAKTPGRVITLVERI